MTEQDRKKLAELTGKSSVDEKKQLSFNQKVVKVQSELKAPKGQYNSFGKYRYRSCEDIVESVKPILAKYEMTLNLSDEIVQIGDRYYVKALATLSDGNQNIYSIAYAREPEAKKGMDESQVTGTASSYARKYALNGLFAIDDTKDADTDEYANQTKLDEKLLKECEDLKIELPKVAVYLKKTVEALTNDDLKKCIEQKKKANASQKNDVKKGVEPNA